MAITPARIAKSKAAAWQRGSQCAEKESPLEKGSNQEILKLPFAVLEVFHLPQAFFSLGLSLIGTSKILALFLGQHFVATLHFFDHLSPPSKIIRVYGAEDNSVFTVSNRSAPVRHLMAAGRFLNSVLESVRVPA